VTPASLLLLAFLIQTTSALSSPPWQAIVPQLVPRPDLPAAIAANSVGVNISRALGPALGGAVTVAAGIAAPFWINAASNLATVGALVWWRAPPRTGSGLPAERFASAIRIGVRHARHNRALRATLVRAAAFFLFASAYWALLPLVARDAIGGGPEVYGVLLGAIGAGAVGGAFALPRLKAKLGADRMMGAGALGTAVAMCLYGVAHDLYSALAASALAGVSWIAVLSSLNVSAQLALPEWVRGRGLAIYVTCFFGALTVGSAIWGEVARLGGLEAAHLIAAAGLLLAIPLTWRWKLQSGAGLDLTPSMHWPAVVGREVDGDEGPVLVTVEYRLAQEHRDEFLAALERLAHQRRRDGAYAWGVYEDTAVRGRYLETFLVESWLEHLRQHERVTNADRVLQQHVQRLLVHAPQVTHFVAAKRNLASQA
jgi:predicted MFS family arabinose efflux permease/quinol monooxygenase YgiN